MTIEQTVRAHEMEELRQQLPRILAGAFAAALLGAGAFGIALWATDPPTPLPAGAVEKPPTGVVAAVGAEQNEKGGA